MNGLNTIATVSAGVWIGLVAMAGLMIVAAVRLNFLERFGASLAGDNKHRREALARTASDDGAAKVARFAHMLADSDEVRTIRWTPARTPEGVRIALGASPKAWYLWLPVPMVLIRVPDALFAAVHHDSVSQGVVSLRCEVAASEEVATATDGESVETAVDSLQIAASFLEGLVIVDPTASAAPAASVATDGGGRDRVAVSLAS